MVVCVSVSIPNCVKWCIITFIVLSFSVFVRETNKSLSIANIVIIIIILMIIIIHKLIKGPRIAE